MSNFAERDAMSRRTVAEDIGRDTTLDNWQRPAPIGDLATKGDTVIDLDRISSEMVFKAASVGVAERLNIAVCGYLRRGSMNVYTHPWRVVP